MTIYKTARGKSVDMGALFTKNENLRAVGNANLNARGDILNEKNEIVQKSSERVKEGYAQTVGNAKAPKVERVDHTQLSPEELEFELEEIIKKEPK